MKIIEISDLKTLFHSLPEYYSSNIHSFTPDGSLIEFACRKYFNHGKIFHRWTTSDAGIIVFSDKVIEIKEEQPF